MNVLKYNNANLYLKYIANPEKEKQRRSTIKMVIPALILVLILGGVIAALITVIVGLKSLYTLTDSVNQDPQINADYEEAWLLDNDTQYHIYLSDRIAGFDEAVNSYPDVTSEIIGNVFECNKGNVRISDLTYEATAGTVSFTVSADGVNDVPDYVESLRKSGKYLTVFYSGYQLDEDEGDGMEIAASSAYNFEVKCVLLPIENGKEDEVYEQQTQAYQEG